MVMKKLPTSMDDIQSRYQAIPYGWKEIDVAAVVALLIYEQKVTIKYSGATIHGIFVDTHLFLRLIVTGEMKGLKHITILGYRFVRNVLIRLRQMKKN